jgi:hypothetical protein
VDDRPATKGRITTLAAGGTDLLATHDVVGMVVSALHQHVGQERGR